MAKPKKKDETQVTEDVQATGSTALEALIAQVKADRALLATPIEDVRVANRAGHQILCREAEDRIGEATNRLHAMTIPGRLVAIFASGDEQVIGEVISAISEGGVVLDAGKMWRDAAAVVEKTFGPERRWTTTQWSAMMQEIAEAARAAGFNSMDPLPVDFEVDTSDVAGYVRGLVSRSDVSETHVRNLKASVIDAVVEGELTAAYLPVLVVGAAQDETNSLKAIFARSAMHEFKPGEEVSKASITEILKSAN